MSVLTDNTAKLRKILEKVENLPEIPQSVAQATPTISVSSGGLITATATQEAGAVAAGTKSATRQLTTKGGTTITPGTSEQTAVSAGTYVTGDIKVAGVTPGKQVATGTATLSTNMANKTSTISFAPGFNPAYALLVRVTEANSSGTQGKGQYMMLKDGSWSKVYTNLSGGGSKVTASYSNGTVTLTGDTSVLTGNYQWVAYA